jgi:NAD+ kinase
MSVEERAGVSPTVRRVLLIAHTGRPAAVTVAGDIVRPLHAAGIEIRALKEEAGDLGLPDLHIVGEAGAADDCDLVLVLGGDGTLLRGAEFARATGTPLLGVNLGHVGFLAESERDEIDAIVDAVVHRRYRIENRMTIDVAVHYGGEVTVREWALNDASVEKASRERMLEIVAEIDGHPLSRWGCDGAVCATPTGSTAYAFSAGGPVVWPEVEALLLVPISAHALFARPLVVGPSSTIAIELLPGTPGGVLWCDGRRTYPLPAGARVEVRRGAEPVRFARLHERPFTDRLVAKFELPVHGWRGPRLPPAE